MRASSRRRSSSASGVSPARAAISSSASTPCPRAPVSIADQRASGCGQALASTRARVPRTSRDPRDRDAGLRLAQHERDVGLRSPARGSTPTTSPAAWQARSAKRHLDAVLGDDRDAGRSAAPRSRSAARERVHPRGGLPPASRCRRAPAPEISKSTFAPYSSRAAAEGVAIVSCDASIRREDPIRPKHRPTPSASMRRRTAGRRRVSRRSQHAARDEPAVDRVDGELGQARRAEAARGDRGRRGVGPPSARLSPIAEGAADRVESVVPWTCASRSCRSARMDPLDVEAAATRIAKIVNRHGDACGNRPPVPKAGDDPARGQHLAGPFLAELKGPNRAPSRRETGDGDAPAPAAATAAAPSTGAGGDADAVRDRRGPLQAADRRRVRRHRCRASHVAVLSVRTAARGVLQAQRPIPRRRVRAW